MKDVFITKIKIDNVRHLKGITIDIDENERKHLIITGKNGSGKTSVLEALKSYILEFDKIRSDKLAENKSTNTFRERWKASNHAVLQAEKEIGISIPSQLSLINDLYKQGKLLLVYIKANKAIVNTIPKGIQKIPFQDVYDINAKIGSNFIQHLVNLKAEASFARDENDTESAKKIKNWFNNFEKSLRTLFDDEGLELVFDRKEYNFYFKLSNGNTPDINQLSDGYSAILNIVAEIILRMEKKSPMIHDMQGIVLIDEIEAHLHVDLQKKILPFLTNFFPRIQFICTTHSPFVISSNANCVIYDLEKQIRIEDATGYSYDTLIESYFGSDKYSHIVADKVEEFEVLSSKSDLSNEEKSKLFRLESYFEGVPRVFAPELDVKLQQIKLRNLSRKTG